MTSRRPTPTSTGAGPSASDADESKTSEERELLEQLANTTVDEISLRQRLLGEIRRVRRQSREPD